MAGGSNQRHDKTGNGKKAGSSYSVDEVVEMARALSEGNLDWQLSQRFEGELGALAGHIESLRQRLKGISLAADSSSYLLPQAVMGVAGISHQGGGGVNSVFELVGGGLPDQGGGLEMGGGGKRADGRAPDPHVFPQIAPKNRRGPAGP